MCASAMCWAMYLWVHTRADTSCRPGQQPSPRRHSICMRTTICMTWCMASSNSSRKQQQQQQQRLKMRSACRCARKCVAQWRPSWAAAHGKRGQQNVLRIGSEGRGVVWLSEWPDNSAMERSPS
eukprot:366091-Chlamydomonas_euryale.AAC.3